MWKLRAKNFSLPFLPLYKHRLFSLLSFAIFLCPFRRTRRVSARFARVSIEDGRLFRSLAVAMLWSLVLAPPTENIHSDSPSRCNRKMCKFHYYFLVEPSGEIWQISTVINQFAVRYTKVCALNDCISQTLRYFVTKHNNFTKCMARSFQLTKLNFLIQKFV